MGGNGALLTETAKSGSLRISSWPFYFVDIVNKVCPLTLLPLQRLVEQIQSLAQDGPPWR
jgi:hypothetical protein